MKCHYYEKLSNNPSDVVSVDRWSMRLDYDWKLFRVLSWPIPRRFVPIAHASIKQHNCGSFPKSNRQHKTPKFDFKKINWFMIDNVDWLKSIHNNHVAHIDNNSLIPLQCYKQSPPVHIRNDPRRFNSYIGAKFGDLLITL